MTPASPADTVGLQPRLPSASAFRVFEKTWVRCVLLLLVGAAVRFPALQGQFLWDDGFLTQANPFIKSPLFIVEAFRHNLIADSFSAHYRPVQTISYIFDYIFWNTDPYGFHLSNVLWHVGSGLLLYFLLCHLFSAVGQRWFQPAGEDAQGKRQRQLSGLAFLVALLWLVHPVHSAAVDYISGRADSLAFFFACGGWLLYVCGRELSRRLLRWSCYTAAAGSAFLALCSRESAMMWVLLFVVYLFTLDRKLALRGKLLVLTACLSVVASYGYVRAQGTRGGVTVGMAGSPASVRATLMLRALGDYGRLMLFPGNLHMERSLTESRPIRNIAVWRRTISGEYLSILGLMLAAGLCFGALRKGRAQNLRAAGAGWFVLAYLPISNLIELNATVAEHWLYLPSVGFLLFVVGCALELPDRGRKVALACAYCSVVLLGGRSFVRSSDWVDPETFYRRTLGAGGYSVRVALNLGQIYASQKDYAKAEELCRKVLQLTPDYAIARNNLAVYLSKQGKNDEATTVLTAAAKDAAEQKVEAPRSWVSAMNLARLRYDTRDVAGTLEILAKARQQYPGVWGLISFEAELLRADKQQAAALELVQQFTKEKWWHYSAWLAEGRICAELNDGPSAEAALWHASRLDVHEVEALNLLSLMRQRQNRIGDAFEIQQRAVARQPDEPRQYLMLSDILTQMGRTEEARATLAQVAQLENSVGSQARAN